MNIGKKLLPLRNYFISHQVLTSCIAIIFILCGLCVLTLALYNTYDVYKHLNCKTGVVSYWERTGGKYNTATMNIKYDSNTYTTERFGGWLCLQHSGKQGEKVIFYTNEKIKRNNKNQIRYFGLSTIDSPRHTFWVFLDILSYIFESNIFLFIPGIVGCLYFNMTTVKSKIIRTASWILPFLTLFLIGLATTS
jgi:hypothetical protein